MNAGGFELRAMAALLAQGRWLRAISLLLLAAALAGWWLSTAWLSDVVLLGSIAAGLAQAYYALRVDFDARLLQALADTAPAGEDPADAARRLDAGLIGLRLLPAARAGRDWDARWRGALGLLRRQAIALGLQLLLLSSAVLLDRPGWGSMAGANG
ncbi:hypothetical protein K4L06_10270 [Lysobacter sp. BMK333-48F3]|uniref:hypothetical protein n=1 Tax=Lysobacter sp. BMK333-48F3 TaxID=2867962 RepID=UPI001C8CA841|nr:hypothetical protein [Lysobacter sp. BMK333-48F3]MBX9401697.1 hypothetical protein [Lysobacter sp. BMK333-48F3]